MFKYCSLLIIPRMKSDFFVEDKISEPRFLQIKCNYIEFNTRAIALTQVQSFLAMKTLR